MIDDANLCSPSVLDRLNSLLEPNGTLTVTERGVINGNIEEIRPHPSFRFVFLYIIQFYLKSNMQYSI